MVLLRLAWLAAGLVVAGCYEPFPPSGAPCNIDDPNPCPSGQSCVRGTCRAPGDEGGMDASMIPESDAPTIDGPPSDLDGDGVANTVDNCSTKHNSDQHDEDKDSVGDVCDNCPHLANTNQAQTGESATPNGAGDACDPRPGVAGDTIQKFYSFHVPPAGTSTTGTWTIVDDAYRYTGGGRGSLIVSGARDKVVVEVAGSLDSNTPDLWLAVSAGEANNRYHNCGYWDCVDCGGLNNDFHNGVIEYFDGGGFELLQANHELPQRLSGSFTIRIASDSTADRVTCTTSDTRGAATKTFNGANLLVPGVVGVRSEFASYRLRYLVVFGQP